MKKNGMIRKIRLISKFVTSQPGWQTITMHVVPNIPRNKSNQTVEIGQLIEYNMRNISVEKFYAKCGEETIPKPFSKKTKLSISLDQ